ncbi:methionine-gamma-lyase [Thermoflexales bacterium]|nr:methionine-gamma-lyase [Thermoflexales bacterium]
MTNHFSTQAVHAGNELPAPAGHPVSPAIYPAVTYTYDHLANLSAALHENAGYSYARYGSPTIALLEQAVATLEGTQEAVAYASGMSALHGAFAQANITPDRPVVAARNVYGATYTLLNQLYAASGALHFVEITDWDAVQAAIEQYQPRAVVLETISNPLLKIPDIPAITRWAHAHAAIVIVDNTFATPYLYRPIDHGVDVVVHSVTKYLGGHGDVLGGVVATTAQRAHELRLQQRSFGANLGPFEAWLTLRGLRTLALRMREQCVNALQVAQWLQGQPAIARVIYPGLPDHPNHDLAQQLFRANHFGGMVSFELRDAAESEVFRFMEKLRLIQAATSLGDIYSLLLYPAQSSHHALGREERLRQGIGDGLVRLSVGIEDVRDIIADLEQALS